MTTATITIAAATIAVIAAFSVVLIRCAADRRVEGEETTGLTTEDA